MLNKIRGEQIKPGVLTNQHFADGAAIDESKLNIDWQARTTEILASRTVIDFVQVNDAEIVESTAILSVDAYVTGPAAEADTDRGVVVQSGKNLVIVRDAVTGGPIIGSEGKEVYAKITNEEGYTLRFFSKDATGDEIEEELSGVTIDFQYPQRFDLSTVSETFAANEKFVDGAVNVTDRLDLEQIVKDAFGVSYTLDHDGQTNLGSSLVAQIAAETAAREGADEVLEDAIEAETLARTNAITGLDERLDDVESELTAARGASASLSVELQRISDLVSTGTDDEVEEARVSVRTGPHDSLNDRLDAGETVAAILTDEIQEARGGKASLADRLDDVDLAISSAASNASDADAALELRIEALEEAEAVETHGHFAEDKQVLAADPLIGTSTYTLTSVEAYTVGDKSLQVYLNGLLQMAGVHYNEVNGGLSINFAPNLIEENDIIQLRWSK